MGLSLVRITSKPGVPARYSVNARSITLVDDALQYSNSMPVFCLKTLKTASALSVSNDP